MAMQNLIRKSILEVAVHVESKFMVIAHKRLIFVWTHPWIGTSRQVSWAAIDRRLTASDGHGPNQFVFLVFIIHTLLANQLFPPSSLLGFLLHIWHRKISNKKLSVKEFHSVKSAECHLLAIQN